MSFNKDSEQVSDGPNGARSFLVDHSGTGLIDVRA